MQITGVTGTNGKTSCTYFLTQALTLLHKKAVFMGTIGVGPINALVESTHTTLPAPQLEKYLAQFQQEGVEYLNMEVSSHALVQKRTEHAAITVAVFTNLTQDHLDYHHTMEAYGKAKILLFQYPTLQYAVINLDDPFSNEIIAVTHADLPIIGISLHGNTHPRCQTIIKGENIQLSEQGIHADIMVNEKAYTLHSHLLGEFNVYNLLCVLGALCALQIPIDESVSVLSQLQEPKGRLSRLGIPGKTPSVFIDYAHTPDALQKSLSVLKALCQGKLWCVFGCGGDRDATKRPIMAQIAEQYADKVIVTDDNPRTESSEHIIADIIKGFHYPDNVMIEHDRVKAITLAIDRAGLNDFVLIAGKGHEEYQIIGTEKIHLSDFEIANAALKQTCAGY